MTSWVMKAEYQRAVSLGVEVLESAQGALELEDGLGDQVQGALVLPHVQVIEGPFQLQRQQVVLERHQPKVEAEDFEAAEDLRGWLRTPRVSSSSRHRKVFLGLSSTK